MVTHHPMLQGGTMDQHPAPAAPPAPTARPPARRSSTDRIVGGVSTATAQYLGVSIGIARIIFLVATLVGGLGLVLYATLWLFVPDDRERVLIQGAAASSGESFAAAAVAGLATLTLSAWITRDGPGWLASILVAVGVLVMSRRSPSDVTDPPPMPTDPPGPAAPTMPVPPPPMPPPTMPGDTDRTPTTVVAPPELTGPDPFVPSDAAGTSVTGVLPLVAERTAVFPRATPGPRSPERLDPPPPKPPKPAAFLGPLTVSIAVAMAGSLSILDAIGAVDLRPSDILIAVLVVVGLGLLLSTWFGRARGLVLLGLLLVPAVAVSAVVDRIDLRGGTGERTWTPLTAAQLRDRYRLGAGSLQLDLTDLDVGTLDPDDPTLRTELSLGTGQVQVIVPEDWRLDVVSNVEIGSVWSYSGGTVVPGGRDPYELGAGEVRWDLDGTEEWYFPEREKVPNDPGDDDGERRTIQVAGEEGAPTLDLDVDVTAGVVEVFRVAS